MVTETYPADTDYVGIGFHGLMVESHESLARRFAELLVEIEVNAPNLRTRWTAFDRHLVAHMHAEEIFVLPAFARAHQHEALELLRDHGRIREHLMELGVALDLHCIRLGQSHAFITSLNAHAAREERFLYRWVDAHLDVGLVSRTRDQLGPLEDFIA